MKSEEFKLLGNTKYSRKCNSNSSLFTLRSSLFSSQILKLALPSVVTNITVPLLGLVDMTIVGHMGASAYIGAVAIGTTIFNMIYWLFAFLRMGTTGIVSQAHGAGDTLAVREGLRRSLLWGGAIALGMLLLQTPLLRFSLWLMAPEPEVVRHAATYFRVCIWGAPAMLASYSLTGWFIGMQDTRTPMWMAILQNLLNIFCTVLFVFVFHLGVAGVALGTVVGVYGGCLYAAFSEKREVRSERRNDNRGERRGERGESNRTAVGLRLARPRNVLDLQNNSQEAEVSSLLSPLSTLHQKDSPLSSLHQENPSLFTLHFSLFLRTLCLVAVTVYFTTAGSRLGGLYLDANALLMQFFIVYSYFTDGLANAAEALSGEHVGRHDHEGLLVTIRSLFRWGFGLALLFTLLYALSGTWLLSLLTNQTEVLQTARPYLPWLVCVPLVALPAFVWDGVYIGMTATRQMFLSMLAAAIVFFSLWALLGPRYGNHALWLAFLAYLAMRSLMQTLLFRWNKHE